MPKLWSEIRRARAMEIIADAAMLIWVGSWTTLSWRLYNFLAGFARAGRSIREGGASLNTAGDQIGEALGRAPVIGHRMAELVRLAFSSASARFVEFGGTLERVILIIAALLSLVVLAIALNLWFQRYLPWRVERLRTIGAAHRAIRLAVKAGESEIERLLGHIEARNRPDEVVVSRAHAPRGLRYALREIEVCDGLLDARLEDVLAQRIDPEVAQKRLIDHGA